MRVLVFLERPIISYIVMGVFSVASAVIFFNIGGSVAEVTGQENTFIGVTFKAGGALAGFLLIFWLSLRVLERLRKAMPEERRLPREFLLRVPEQSLPQLLPTLVCKYMLYDREGGGWSAWNEISYVKEGRGLKIYVREMEPRHVIRVRLEDGQTHAWEPEEDQPYGVTTIYLRHLGQA